MTLYLRYLRILVLLNSHTLYFISVSSANILPIFMKAAEQFCCFSGCCIGLSGPCNCSWASMPLLRFSFQGARPVFGVSSTLTSTQVFKPGKLSFLVHFAFHSILTRTWHPHSSLEKSTHVPSGQHVISPSEKHPCLSIFMVCK